jgi:hypothetical protein
MMVRRAHSLGLLLALLALLMQIGVSAPLPQSDAEAVLAAASFCHPDDGSGAPARPHTPDCALCPLCLTVASMPFALPASGPRLPLPRVVALPRSDAPIRTSPPPSTARLAARPRAPPFQA